MNFTVISEQEARSKYRRAENKMAAIHVIADLTVSKKEEVAEFLGVKLIKMPPWVSESEEA